MGMTWNGRQKNTDRESPARDGYCLFLFRRKKKEKKKKLLDA